MSHAAIIENGIVKNVIVSDAGFAASIGAIPCNETVSIGWSYDEVGKAFAPPVGREIDLGDLKFALKMAVDAAAEFERHKYITPGSGQAMTYQAKAAEAQRYADTDGAGEYPFLSQEVGITGYTLTDVAAVVLAMHTQWLTVGSEIEKVRLSAKVLIDAAADEVSAKAVIPVWPEPPTA